jgi:hypothetical protein
MPTSRRVTVTTSATILVPESIGDQTALIHASNDALYIGGADLTTANGYLVDSKDKLTVPVGDHTALYGVVASGTTVVSVLYQVN